MQQHKKGQHYFLVSMKLCQGLSEQNLVVMISGLSLFVEVVGSNVVACWKDE